MRYEQNLQVRLQERYRRLMKADWQVYGREASYLRDFVLGTPALKAIVDSVERSVPDLDPALWVADHFKDRGYDWPETEESRAKVCWYLVRTVADGSVGRDLLWHLSGETNYDAMWRDFTEAVVEPLIEFLQEGLGTESDVLYLLEKYKRRVEWFERDRLFAEYEGDTARGEAKYDTDLRQFLFDQGVDYPFSKPASASGEADVVSGIEGDDPLVCEVKLFDAGSYGAAYLGQGVTQAIQYAHDFGKTTAHLVIINLSERDPELPSDEDRTVWPPRLHVSGVTVYLVAIRACPLPSASQRGRIRPVVIEREQLVGEP